MEHPCHRCGSAVPDSSAFCPDCGAPQVRFSRPPEEADAVSVSPSSARFPQVVLPAQEPHEETTRRVLDRERSVALRSAVKAGAIAAAISLFPMGIFIAMPLCGFLAVLFYRGQSWRAEPTRSSGFKLGALAGLFGFGVFTTLAGLATWAFKDWDEFRHQMLEALQHAQSRYSDAQQRQALDYLMSPQGLTLAIILGLIFTAVVFVFLSGVGGSLAAAFLRRRGPKA